jgi:hypothetical protein
MECAESDSDLATDESSSLSPDWNWPCDAELSDMPVSADDLTLSRDATDFSLNLISERSCSGS